MRRSVKTRGGGAERKCGEVRRGGARRRRSALDLQALLPDDDGHHVVLRLPRLARELHVGACRRKGGR